jgi:hypothetical protein
MPIYYSINGSNPQPVPSTGMFSSLGKQSTAMSKQDAVSKAKASSLNFPGTHIWGADVKDYGYLVQYQNGGKRRKSRRGYSKTKSGRKTRKNKSRRK